MIGPDKGDGSWERTQQMISVSGLVSRIGLPGSVSREEVPRWLERGASEETLMAVLTEQHAGSTTARPVVAEACRHARSLAADGDRVLVFGSCYMVGPAMEALGLYCGPNQPDDRSSRWTGV